jgi:outer membrane receptor for ferrienterochelin and colicin
MVKIPSLHMEYEGNIFYDNVKDIINLNDYSYINSGVVKAIGLENTLSYNYMNWIIRGTLYIHTVIDADDLSASGNKFYSVPNLSAHLQASKMLFRNFWLMTNFSFSTKNDFKYPDYSFLNGLPIGSEVKELPSCFLADVGATYKWKFLELNVKCKNIFNHQYRLGGDRVPVLQEGRSILATLSINLTD